MSLLVEYLHACGRFQRNARLYLLSNALSGVTTAIIVVLYNLYLASLGYKTDFIGLVYLVAAIGAGIGILPAGFLVDRLGGKAVLIWSSVAIGIAGTAQLVLRQPIPLLLSVFIVGLAGACTIVVNAPFLTNNSTPIERPQLFSLNIVIALATTVLGEIVGGALPLWFRSIPWLMSPFPTSLNWLLADQALPRSYQLTMLLAGIIAAPSFIPLFLLDDDKPQRTERPQGDAPTDADLRTGHPQGDAPTKIRAPRWHPRVFVGASPCGCPVFAMISRYLSHPQKMVASAFFMLIVVQVLIAFGAGLFIPYFNLYFVQHLGASSALFGLIDGGANAINALLTLLAPLLAARIGKINTITVTRLLSIPLLLTLAFTSTLPLATLLYLFRQGTMDMSLGLFQVYAMEAVPEHRRGIANSSYQIAMYVPNALAASIGGVIITHNGYAPVFVAGAIFYVVAIGVLWGRFGSKRQ